MNILLVPDKFKGSLTAREVIVALKKGILDFKPTSQIHAIIASDGGDGFLEAITENNVIEKVHIKSSDPLGREINSVYGINAKERTAYIELANCAGLSLLSSNEINVLRTSTFGTGVQIKNAIGKGANKIYIGLGGSATNDGGIGIAAALGYRFLDRNNNDLDPIGENLSLISKIIKPTQDNFDNIMFYAVNDVQNPLFGKMGAAMTYAKQKGGDSKVIDLLDNGLRNLDSVVKQQLKIDAAHELGTGAAGGAAYGLKVFFNADFLKGIDFILKQSGAIHLLKDHKIDLIITGEGKIDDQTAHGKLVNGVAVIGNQFNIPVIAICGKKELVNAGLKSLGLKEIIVVSEPSKSLEYNMKNVDRLIQTSILYYLMKTYKNLT
ncbi:MAG: glycerate kinase [Flavobacteriaceae bacterium]|nr:glycerate kinase [Flavobacteriaceae bacterium]